MRRIILEQIAELPAKEKRQIRAFVNHILGTEYAAHQRRKKVMTEETKIKLGVDDNENQRT